MTALPLEPVVATATVRRIGVVVPARDEAARLARCLGALAAAVRALGEDPDAPRVTTVVVADKCTDGTADIARSWPGVRLLRTQDGCVGAARATGARHLLARWRVQGVPLAAAWIANTDADSVVPSDWLTTQYAASRSGTGLLLGTVRPDLDDVDPRVTLAWLRRHTLTDGHPHVHGANLGVRADIYSLVGGFAALEHREDVTFAAAVVDSGAAVVRTAASPVRTSGRHVGRTPGGFAGYLRGLQHTGPRLPDTEATELPA